MDGGGGVVKRGFRGGIRQLAVRQHTTEALQQRGNIQIARAHIRQRVQRATQDVVAALILAGALDDLDILRLFHHAYGRGVALRINTDAADILAGDIAADAAEGHAIAHRAQCVLQPLDVLGFHVQNVKRDALRRLRADARQARKLVDEVLQRSFKHQLLPKSAKAAAPPRGNGLISYRAGYWLPPKTSSKDGPPWPPMPWDSGPIFSCARRPAAA